MKFKFLGNAGGTFIGTKGTKILCDPWLIDGVFEGAWYHYPPLVSRISDIKNVDAIYLSHIHSDHYDQRNFEFSKEMPIILLDEGPNFLKKNLINKGFKNIIDIKNDQTVNFKEFNLTMYKPFSKHIYEESFLGNLVDSSLVLENDGVIAINFNDNTPDKKSCVFLKEKFKNIDLAMLNYNAAGPYPSCFDNLTAKEKIIENNRILKRNFDHLCEIIPILKPKAVLPFAGAYVIGGKNYYKNDYLGTTTWDECADYLKKNLKFESKIFCLRENHIFDVKNNKQLNKYKKIDLKKMKEYIQSIKKNQYTYENDDMPDKTKIIYDLRIASTKMLERLKKYKVSLKTNIFIKIEDEDINIYKGTSKDFKLYCNLDLRLLRRILDRKSHWNDAEVGTHINFKRYPNKMEPDAHTCMSFFHL